MHVVVLGAGVVGVTTAYYLTELGHTVTVIDQADVVADGASGGNGGQLSYSFTEPMASPELLSKLPKVLAGMDDALYFRPPINPLLIRWGWAFLRQCSTRRFHENMLSVLQLALRSSTLLSEIQSRIPLDFSFRQAGKLVMLDKQEALPLAAKICLLKSQHGCESKVITFKQAQEIEPALSHMSKPYAGAVYSVGDQVGDASTFTAQLSHWLTKNTATEFQLGSKIQQLVTTNDSTGRRVHTVETDKHTLKPDAVVVCLGAWSSRLFRPLGIKSDIYPVRGYSLTLPPGNAPNIVSITDSDKKLVFSRIGDTIRIAGFADFGGLSTDRDIKRARKMLSVAQKIAPDLANYDVDSIGEWGGFRPMTPDSRPLVGPTKIKGLYLNTGHGMLGWTLACATGYKVASIIK